MPGMQKKIDIASQNDVSYSIERGEIVLPSSPVLVSIFSIFFQMYRGEQVVDFKE